MNESVDAINSLAKADYVSLATFRKSGQAVATPVWCAEDQGEYFVFSAGNAGKVKRLRNGNRARLAVCTGRGKVLDPWCDAEAFLIDDEAGIERALAALRRKYGWQMWLADVGSKLTGKFQKRSYIRVRLVN